MTRGRGVAGRMGRGRAAGGLLALLRLLATAATAGAVTLLTDPLTLPAHPRLIMNGSRVAAMRAAVANVTGAYPGLAELYYQFTYHADYVKNTLAVQSTATVGPLIGTSDLLGYTENARDAIVSSALAHLLRKTDNDTSYLARAVAEVREMCLGWSSWDVTKRTLSTAHAMTACSLAYDWLYNDLNATMRASLAGAIITKGLERYRARVTTPYDYTNGYFWVNISSNWNFVCSQGGLLAALAVYGDGYNDSAGTPVDSWLVGGIVNPLVTSLAYAAAEYGTDGSAQEGVTYDMFGAQAMVHSLASLTTAVGSTLGLATPGILAAGRYPIWEAGPGFLTGGAVWHNWADCGLETWRGYAPSLQWLGDPAASAFQRLLATKGLYSWLAKGYLNGAYADAIAFYDPAGSAADIVALPPSRAFDNHVGVLRGPWNTTAKLSNALFFKGGDAAYGHQHLDHGSFNYDLCVAVGGWVSGCSQPPTQPTLLPPVQCVQRRCAAVGGAGSGQLQPPQLLQRRGAECILPPQHARPQHHAFRRRLPRAGDEQHHGLRE